MAISKQDLQKIIGDDKILGKAYTELNKFHWTNEELLAYEAMKRAEMDEIARRDQQLDDAEERGIEKGIKKGREEGREEIAVNLLKEGFKMDAIVRLTGFSKEQIEKLRG
ncbi:MAG TPA: hypothetical protein VGZ69_03585 [Candidatus Rhabdochlamydia sp.]|nr:hypothetical protein [Candidatus Rhabdochlamydia sp.]